MISDDKLRHIIQTARKCRDIARSYDLPDDMQIACFMMGLLHDIGYEECNPDESSIHPRKSCEMIYCFLKYKDEILRAIASHGDALTQMSVFENILNTADLTIDSHGNDVSISDRLDRIETRYGENSRQFKNAQTRINAIKSSRKEEL